MARRPNRPASAARAQAAKALSEASRDLTAALAGELGEAGEQISAKVAALAEELGQAGEQISSKLAASLEKTAASLEKVGRSSARAENTRAALLRAAATVISAKGYEGASVEDIAKAAGFTKGAVYAHFGSKEELFLELGRAHCAAGIEALASVDTHGRSFIDWYVDQIAGFGSGADRPGGADDAGELLDDTSLLSIELGSFALRHADYRDQLADRQAAFLDALARRIHADRTGQAVSADGQAEVPREDYVTAIGLTALASEFGVHAQLGVRGVDTEALHALASRLTGR